MYNIYQNLSYSKNTLSYATCCFMEDATSYTTNTFIKYPHDKLFRDLLNSKTEFTLFLKSFLHYDITPNKLEKYNRSFITNEYNNQHADIVYKIVDEPISFLVEHQSYIDYSLPYRLLEYYLEILRSSTDKHTIKQKHIKFPTVCPIVLYVGEENWDFETNIGEKQFDSNYLGKINIAYHFIDIHNYTKEKLLHMNSCIAYAMALYKCQTEEESIELLLTLSKQNFTTQRKHIFQRILQFLMRNFLDDSTIDLLIKKFKEEGMTMDPFIERMKKDRLNYGQKMKQEGVLQGVSQGKLEIIRNMLKSGLSLEEIKKYSGCTKKNIEKIKQEMEVIV